MPPTICVLADEGVHVITSLGVPGTIGHVHGNTLSPVDDGLTLAPVGVGRWPLI